MNRNNLSYQDQRFRKLLDNTFEFIFENFEAFSSDIKIFRDTSFFKTITAFYTVSISNKY